MKKSHCYFKGRITTSDKIKITPYDLGILRGYGVFDVMAVFNKQPFLWKEHYNRLKSSAKALNLKVPISQAKFREVAIKLAKKNKYPNATIRTVLTGGVSPDGFCPEKGQETFYILVEKFKFLPKSLYKKGGKLMLHDYQRENPRAKVTNYIEAIKLTSEKKKKKAIEILYYADLSNVLECTTSNLFVFHGNNLITPKNGILLGITRNFVLKLAKKAKFEVKEKELSLSDVLEADEVFISATNKNIVPIVKIEDNIISDGKVGENTKILMNMFDDYINR